MSEQSESGKCCPPDCCDMRGFLTFQILWELNKGPLNGHTKPTPGTIYPALKDLREGGSIVGTKEGNQVIYTLTEAGKKGLDDASRYFHQAFGDIAEDVKVRVIKIGNCD
ncbi:MAG: PadR family transcriptional regulator [Candidatus Thorarchaeota archaeon]|jgi:DNA-binding PadR family transcriptional regulator